MGCNRLRCRGRLKVKKVFLTENHSQRKKESCTCLLQGDIVVEHPVLGYVHGVVNDLCPVDLVHRLHVVLQRFRDGDPVAGVVVDPVVTGLLDVHD